MSTNPTPEAGQVWADNDERTKGSGEFTILYVDNPAVTGTRNALVQRGNRKVWIRVDRFANTGSRGYRYIGRAK